MYDPSFGHGTELESADGDKELAKRLERRGLCKKGQELVNEILRFHLARPMPYQLASTRVYYTYVRELGQIYRVLLTVFRAIRRRVDLLP